MARTPKILRAVFSIVAAALLLVSGPAEAAPKYQWKLAQTWGSGFPVFGDAVIKMADLVKVMSNGEMEIRIDSANKHKAAFGILDMVKGGQYEMGHSASYYWKGKDVSTMPFTTMPFGMIAPEQFGWFYYGGGKELMKEVYAKHGVYAFPGGNTGNQMGGWFKKEIKTVEDLKGLKMRIPGFAGEVVAKLGVVVTNIAPGELYTALDRGTIDALEWSARPSTSRWASRRSPTTTTPAGTSRRPSSSSWSTRPSSTPCRRTCRPS